MKLKLILTILVGVLLSNCNNKKTQNLKPMDTLNLIEKSKGFIEAFENRDVNKMKSYWAEDQTIYRIPYASGMMPHTYKGKEAFHEFSKEMPNMFENIELDIKEIILDENEKKVVARTEIKLHVKDEGVYENAQIFILRFNEVGDLIEVSEYFNPVPTAIGMRKFGTHDRLLDSLKIN